MPRSSAVRQRNASPSASAPKPDPFIVKQDAADLAALTAQVALCRTEQVELRQLLERRTNKQAISTLVGESFGEKFREMYTLLNDAVKILGLLADEGLVDRAKINAAVAPTDTVGA